MSSRRTVLRGGRLGGAPGAEIDRGGPVEPRQRISYWCRDGHESNPTFAVDAEVPDMWECGVCGRPASRSESEPPAPEPAYGASPKTPWEFLMMRRTLADGEKLLDEALERLRADRTARRRTR